MKQVNLEKYITLSERYTKALLKTAKEDNAVEKIGEDLKNVVETFSNNEDIGGFFVSPVIKTEDKKEILEKAFKNKINDKLYNFLNVLIDKKRILILPNIETLYTQKLAEEKNILEVEVQSAIELDDDMKNKLIEKLTKITNKSIVLNPVINKEIIGGLVLSFDGKVIDGSVKTQLKSIQKQLI